MNIQTGKENYHIQIKNPFSDLPLWSKFWQLHGNKMIYYQEGRYIEYDLIQQRVTYSFNIEEKLKKERLWPNVKYIKEGNLLYFYIDGNAYYKPSIAILDINAQEIVWKYFWENNNKAFYRNFQKSDTHLYILDSENTLHIFERQ